MNAALRRSELNSTKDLRIQGVNGLLMITQQPQLLPTKEGDSHDKTDNNPAFHWACRHIDDYLRDYRIGEGVILLLRI